MKTSTHDFVQLHAPFYAESCGTADGETVNHFVQDSNGVTVIEYCPSKDGAEKIAALLTSVEMESVVRNSSDGRRN